MRQRESYLRRRVSRWRAWVAYLVSVGRAPPVRQPTEAEVREKLRAFRALSVADRMTMPGADYADRTDLAFVLDLLDVERDINARYRDMQTAPHKALDSEPMPDPWPYIDPPPRAP